MDHRHRMLLSVSVVLCAALIYIYPLALPTPLLDPDEGLHASISQEMVESNDYLVPRFLGKPFLDKPILYFEAQAISLRCFGMTEAAVRLPGLMFGLLGAITTSLLAWRLFDAATGLLALLVSLTSIVPLSVAQSAAHDVALVPWTNLLLLCWWAATEDNRQSRTITETIGATLFVGLAVLTKGLIGVAVVYVGFALYVAVSRQRASRFIVCSTTSVLGGLVLASPWFVAMEWRAPGYLHYYFFERHILGFVTHTQPHGLEPWYFYFGPLVAGTIPWILYVVPSQWQYWKVARDTDASHARATLFLFCWLFGGLIFLSLAKSKLITYALPLYPAIAILAGHACKQFVTGELLPPAKKACDWIFFTGCLAGTVVPLGILFALDRYNYAHSPPVAYCAAAVTTMPMLFALRWMRRNQPLVALAIGSLWFPLLFVTIMTWPMQTLAENRSQRQLASKIRSLTAFPNQIYLVDARISSVMFYLEPEQRKLLHRGQIAEVESSCVDSRIMRPNTLLAMRTATRANFPLKDLPHLFRELSVAGDYCVLAAPAQSCAADKTPQEDAW